MRTRIKKIKICALFASSSLLFFMLGVAGAIIHGITLAPVLAIVCSGVVFVTSIFSLPELITEE